VKRDGRCGEHAQQHTGDTKGGRPTRGRANFEKGEGKAKEARYEEPPVRKKKPPGKGLARLMGAQGSQEEIVIV